MEKALGGDRLGSGNKIDIRLKHYERSTHDLSYTWRSTMASGTLVPFMSELALPGDKFDIKLNTEVLTHPTIGPLFGSYKVQLDVFQVPIRLYQASLHMNKLGIGLDMKNIHLPQIQMQADSPVKDIPLDNQQINSSSIFSYLNIRGLGVAKEVQGDDTTIVARRFNAIPYLGYWDIFKNYYSNKQEENAYVIHNNLKPTTAKIEKLNITQGQADESIPEVGNPNNTHEWQVDNFLSCNVSFQAGTYEEFNPDRIQLLVKYLGSSTGGGAMVGVYWTLSQLFQNITFDSNTQTLTCNGFLNPMELADYEVFQIWNYQFNANIIEFEEIEPRLQEFPLENIDKMREQLLQAPQNGTPYVIRHTEIEPYSLALKEEKIDDVWYYSKKSNQEGLAVKTYQSDLFNNWVSTEWIDGANGINEITKVTVDGDGAFKIDELNLANKIYNMLMRIGVSGGSYRDWQEAVYDHKGFFVAESPIYMGGLIKELAFQEVISNAGTSNQPLGTLAGRGQMTSKHKGGKVEVKVSEPSYIMGIVSLTPRTDYSQGNKWDTNLKTMDDLHKPALDQIGFQDLITDQMAWWDTIIEASGENAIPEYRSAGKQPAWINYMTNVDVVRGNFADETQQMFMVLNRRYENEYRPNTLNGEFTIKDLTTYIDPSKFNHIFAYTRRDAQNFWTQIRCDITARRKMSAKLMPNL